jgi:hypothetical protein
MIKQLINQITYTITMVIIVSMAITLNKIILIN